VSAAIQIQTINEPFEDCENSCWVFVKDVYGRQKEKFKLGIVQFTDLVPKIERGESLSLDYRLVTDFSLTTYRKLVGLTDNHEINLVDFSASHAYFEMDNGVDFSNAKFIGENCDFSNCIFGDGPCNFYSAEFEVDTVNFENVSFGSELLIFNTASSTLKF
jgi:hypothetical protein